MTPEEIRAIEIPNTEFGQSANEQNTALLLLAREFVAQYAEAVEISERAHKHTWGNADLNS